MGISRIPTAMELVQTKVANKNSQKIHMQNLEKVLKKLFKTRIPNIVFMEFEQRIPKFISLFV